MTPPFGPFAFLSMVSAVLFMVLAIAWPHAADSLLRALLVTLAAGFVVVRGYTVVFRVRATHDLYSPFDAEPSAPPTDAPDALRRLTTDLRGLDEGITGRSKPIPWSVCSVLIDEATRRLHERHGLALGEPAHHPAIRTLLSEPTWLLVEPREGESFTAEALGGRRPLVPLTHLDLILDDVEAL